MRIAIVLFAFLAGCAGLTRVEPSFSPALAGVWERSGSSVDRLEFGVDGEYFGYTGETSDFSGLAETRGDTVLVLREGACSGRDVAYSFRTRADTLNLVTLNPRAQCAFAINGRWYRAPIREF